MKELLVPEELADQGRNAYQQEDYQEAASAFEAAEEGYQASGDLLAAAEMANNRSVVLLQLGEAQAALDAVGGTVVVFEQANDKKRQAMALGNKAAALAELDQKEEAETLYWECAKLLAEVGEKDLRASVLTSISKLQMGSGRYLEAVASMDSGLDQVEKPNFRQKIIKKLLKIPGNLVNRNS